MLPEWPVRVKAADSPRPMQAMSFARPGATRVLQRVGDEGGTLIAGSDIAAMSERLRSVLTDKGVIAIDPDALGKQGERIYAGG